MSSCQHVKIRHDSRNRYAPVRNIAVMQSVQIMYMEQSFPSEVFETKTYLIWYCELNIVFFYLKKEVNFSYADRKRNAQKAWFYSFEMHIW